MLVPDLKIKLLVVDDHPLIRQGFKHTFHEHATIQLVAMAANGKEGLEAVKQHNPDVVILDLRMPLMDGREACHQIMQYNSAIGVIVFSLYDHEDLILQMRQAGARGYILKNAESQQIFDAIKVVHNGGEYYCPIISQRMKGLFESGKLSSEANNIKESFTELELKIITLIYQEKTTEEIAVVLGISAQSVEQHKEKIENKMGVKSNVGIVGFALKNWLLY